MPSQPSLYREKKSHSFTYEPLRGTCGWCHERTDLSGGNYDDGEWMYGSCIVPYAG